MSIKDVEKQNFFVSPFFYWLCFFVIALGCLLRFFEITQNSLIFYDEGMYLHHNIDLLDKIYESPPENLNEFFAILRILFLSALTTAKWVWFLISNLRVFFSGTDDLFFTRVISAISGCLTVWLTYRLSRQLFRSREIAMLSAALLALLPSHIFYSRLAMQEAFSTFFFLTGIFLYCTSRNRWDRWILASIALSIVYFTNYRMIVLPVVLFVIEGMLALSERRNLQWIKYTAVVGVFLFWILFFGLINQGSNLFITTAWMGKQAQMASQGWYWGNIFSYPFNVFSLEGSVFFLVFGMSAYFLLKKDWLRFLPAAVVCVQMVIFTFASDKGARYLCVVFPFMAMSAAVAMCTLLQSGRLKLWASVALISILFLSMFTKAVTIVATPTGYQQAVMYIKSKDPRAKVLTSQPMVVDLLSRKFFTVSQTPKSFQELLFRYAQGFRYLMIDPQAYVSWTASGARFTLPLGDYLGFMAGNIKPIAKFQHLGPALLERFVLDHNENLKNSIDFLSQRKDDYGAVYVYDLEAALKIMEKVIATFEKSQGMSRE